MATPEGVQPEELVKTVASRLEVALRADRDCKLDWGTVRLRYVVVSDADSALNASIAMAPEGGKQPVLPTRSLCCWDLHRVGVAPPPGPTPSRSGYGPCAGTVMIGARLISEVCHDDPSRLAVLLGHELAHLASWDFPTVPAGGGDALQLADLDQERELAADEAGLRYALAAGYENAEQAATEVWKAMSLVCGDQSPLEPAGALSTHPSHLMRLQLLQQEPRRRQLYRSLQTFETGAYYLQMGQWEAAQECFESASQRFPGRPEVLTNIAYALMMRFYAALPPEARGRLGGELSCLSYATTHPPILGGTTMDRALLQEAISRYREALAAEPAFLPAQVGLGTALLMDPDVTAAAPGPLAEAVELLRVAEQRARETGDECALIDAATNGALALKRLGRGDTASYRMALERAFKQIPEGAQCLPLMLNLATALAEAKADRREPGKLLQAYLEQTPECSYYHKQARAQLLALGLPLPGSQAGLEWGGAWCLTLPNGEMIALGQEWERVQRALGQVHGTTIPIGQAAQTFTWDCPDLGMQLRLWHGRLRVILLTSPVAPAVEVWGTQDSRHEGPHLTLKVGTPGPIAADGPALKLGTATQPLKISGSEYKLYRATNLAINWRGEPPMIAGLALICGG
ncbi:MAG: M48 family metalloprotease [Armatimonadia bacterium]